MLYQVDFKEMKAVRLGGFSLFGQECAMVTLEYIARTAMLFDTVVSRAFLKAMGIPYRAKGACPAPTPMSVEPRYGSVDECFANHGSPMDGRSVA